MFDYTLSIQAKIKQDEARKANDQRILIREIEAARRAEIEANKRKTEVKPVQPAPEPVSHN
ncbi:MAG: hypothetical protein MUF38_17110 [Anaerolineae bacterium]|jgi:hypothetical protein|nr:hypothetical protein [Anaerolineae bacterium]